MTEHLDRRTYDLLFGVRRSVRYHDRRRRFYEMWNSATVAMGAIGGSAAVATVTAQLSPGWLPAIAAAAVAVASAVDLAVGTARRANHHGDLARQFIGLEQRFAHDRNLDDAEHEELTRERLRIEATEPPVLHLLNMLCHYELLRALGDERPRPPIPWMRAALANWLSQADYAAAVRKRPAIA